MLKKLFSKKSLAVIFLSAFAAVFAIQALAATALILMPAPAQADCVGLADCGNGNGTTVTCPTTVAAGGCTSDIPCCLTGNQSTCGAWYNEFMNSGNGNCQSGNGSSQSTAGSDGTCTCTDGSVPEDQVTQEDCDPNNADNPCFACSDPEPGCSWQAASTNSGPSSAASSPSAASAPTKAYPPLILQVPIPTFSGGQATLNTQITFGNSTAPIANYIKLIYTFAVSAVGIVAAVVLMIGGLMWITAGGNASNVTEAKSMITASITGLVLVLTSYLILNQVNPALINLQPTAIQTPVPQAQDTSGSNCSWQTPQTLLTGSQGMFGAESLCPNNLFKTTVASLCAGQPADISQICCCTTEAGNCTNCEALQTPGGFNVSGSACHINSAQCQGDRDLMDKLSSFYNDFTVTGAWPPTPGAHKAGSCHEVGTCVDVAPTNGGSDGFNKLAADLNGAKAAGVAYVQFECPTSGCCDAYTVQPYNLAGIPCVVNGSGNHFHVQLYAAGQSPTDQ